MTAADRERGFFREDLATRDLRAEKQKSGEIKAPKQCGKGWYIAVSRLYINMASLSTNHTPHDITLHQWCVLFGIHICITYPSDWKFEIEACIAYLRDPTTRSRWLAGVRVSATALARQFNCVSSKGTLPTQAGDFVKKQLQLKLPQDEFMAIPWIQ